MTEIEKARKGMIAVAAVILKSVARRLAGARRLSSGVMMLVMAGMVLLVAAGGAGADTEINSCNFNADTDGEYYYLTGDIDCDANEIGVTIGANNVIIDGKGYKLHGSVASATCTGAESAPCVTHSGVVNDGRWDNVVVKDLEIENFCTGVVMGTSGVTVDGMTVTGCTIHDCGDPGSITHGIHLSGANNCIITENEVYNQKGTADMGDCGSGGNAIAMYGGSGGGHNTITSNYLHHNTKCGLHAKKGCMYNTISYNRATENAGAGIMPECKRSDYNTIEHNIMSDNVCGGFYTCGNHNTIRYNTANNNGVGVGGHGFEIVAGIRMGAPYGANNDVTDNTFCGNGGDDVRITQDQYGWTNIIDKNTCDNANNATYCDWSCTSEPDLVITEKTETFESNAFKVTYTVSNNGEGDAGASTTGIYVGGTQVATDLVGALAAGASHTKTVTIGSFDCPCGTTIAIKVCADNEDVVDESDEENNCLENTFNCPSCAPPEKPDLTITAKSETLTSGTLEVTYTVKNAGGVDAGASATGIYAGSTQIAADPVGALTAGATHTSTVTIDPFNCPCGTTVTIKVCADEGDAVDEGDETNNCRENTFSCPSCPGEPDLVITEKSETLVGSAFTVTYTVKNNGGGDAGVSTTCIYADGAQITTDPVGALAAGATHEGTVVIDPFDCPCGMPVTVKVCADKDRTVDESDETNNCRDDTFSCPLCPSQPPPPAEVPTFTPIGMFAMVGLLGIAGMSVIRRW